MTIRHGWNEGYALGGAVAVNASLAAGAASVITSPFVIGVSGDLDELAVMPFATSSVTDAGVTVDFEFLELMAGATYSTNPVIVRLTLDATGDNKGPLDHLPVTYSRKLKLNRIVNNSATAVLSGLNVEYRLARSRA